MQLARHFFALFVGRFAWVLLFVQLFLGLCSFLVFSAAYPYVAPRLLVAALPDMVLLVLPLGFAIASLGGALLFFEEVRRAQGFLAVELAGRDPRWLQLPLVAFAGLLSAATLWLQGAVIPVADYRLESMGAAIARETPLMALRAVREGEVLNGLGLRFESVSDAGISELALLSESKATAITARRGRFEPSSDGRRLGLVLEDGRYLQLEAGPSVTENARFDRLELIFDAARIGPGAKVDVLPLRYYTNAELDRLSGVPAFRLHHGYRPTNRQTARIAAIPSMRASRAASAFLPLELVALAVALLGVHVRERLGLRTALVVGACLLVLVPQQHVLLYLSSEGPLAHPTLAFLPAIETVAILAIAALTRVVRR